MYFFAAIVEKGIANINKIAKIASLFELSLVPVWNVWFCLDEEVLGWSISDLSRVV